MSTPESEEQYRRIAAGYDHKLQIRLGEHSRRRAFADLDLRAGDTVLDVGCGTGLSFPLIEDAIGTRGRIIGLDPSPEMLALAQDRVSAAEWDNATLIHASAEDAEIPSPADALVIFRVHEVTQSRVALENVLRATRPRARLLVVGVKWAPWYVVPLNLIVWRLTRSMTTTREGFRRPWELLAEFVPDLTVRSVGLGTQYIATGTTAQ
jgi:ubiquinone/menaquinone biosynthesis C-methylase UbiE